MLRRNGKQPSCEPCRKAKISCDHTHPVCRKCQKRNRTSQCYYHPAPMTRRPAELQVAPVSSRRDEDTRSVGIPSPTASVLYAPTQSDGFPVERPPAYEGLGLTGSPNNVLQHLFPLSVTATMVTKYFSLWKLTCIPHFIVKNGMLQLRQDLETAHASGLTLDELYDEILQNTKKPFVIPNIVKAGDFHNLFTGPNLRLEFIGLLYTLAGLTGEILVEGKVAYFTHQEQATFTKTMREAASACIDACRNAGAENEVMLWLLYADTILLSEHHGDTSQAVWRRLGEVATDLTALNLHRDPEPTAGEPFYLGQLRKRLFVWVFRGDKGIATFLNRPPRIARQHCDIRMPLDISDDVLLLEGDELAEALARLDADGWGPEETFSATRYARVLYQLSILREEILELISHKTKPGRDERLSQILEQSRAYWKSIPRGLVYDEGCWERYEDSNESINALWTLAMFLEHRHSQFLILRQLARSDTKWSTYLFQCSMEILDGIMQLMKRWNHVGNETNLSRDASWTLLYYGLPSAAVLATEFRRCTYEGVPLDQNISRSKLIRTISVIAASLEWTSSPKHYYLPQCKEACKTLGSLLDDALNYQPPPTNNALYTPMNDLPGMEHDPPIDSDAFLAWLENMDWNRTMLNT